MVAYPTNCYADGAIAIRTHTHARACTYAHGFIGGMWKRSLCIKYTRLLCETARQEGRGEKVYSGEDVGKF